MKHAEKQMRMYIMFTALSGSLYGGIKTVASPGAGMIDKAIGLVCGLSAMYLLFDRDVYLPFLGDTVIPEAVIINDKMPAGANRVVIATVPANARVIFWAAAPSQKTKSNPWDAYGKYRNSGVTRGDSDGRAVFRIRNPGSYKVPGKGKLEPHLHYRYMIDDGMMSKIFTAPIPDERLVSGII